MMNFFKNKNKTKTGIEITSEGIICAIIKQDKVSINLEALHICPFKESVIKNGHISNQKLLSEELKSFVEKYEIKPGVINISVPSNVPFVKNIMLPNFPLEELKVIAPQEAQKHFPFAPNEAIIDYEIIELPVANQLPKNKVSAVITAISKDIAQSYVEAFEESCINLNAIDISSFSVIRALANAGEINEAEELAISVLIEYENTEITIIYKGMPIFSHNVPVGKRNLISSLVTDMGLTPNEAVKIFSAIDLADAEQLAAESPALSSVQGIYNTISNEIMRTIQNYSSGENTLLGKIVISGCGVCVKGIDKFIEKKLNIKTQIFNPLNNISHELETENLNIPALANCIGLALKG